MLGTTTESFADIDVTADGSYEGCTVAFEDYDFGDECPFMPTETDQDRLTYLQDVFEGSNDIVTAWKSSSSFCQRIDNNGAENRQSQLCPNSEHKFSTRPSTTSRNDTSSLRLNLPKQGLVPTDDGLRQRSNRKSRKQGHATRHIGDATGVDFAVYLFNHC
jgi:hypothetical protein